MIYLLKLYLFSTFYCYLSYIVDMGEDRESQEILDRIEYRDKK